MLAELKWDARVQSTEIGVAIALRKELTGEWPLPLAGTLSIIFGVLLMLLPSVGVLTLVMGFYALIFGMTLMAFALRLRQLAHEIPVAVASTPRLNSSHSTGIPTRNSSGV